MIKKIFFSFIIAFFAASCANKKDILYYQDIQNNTKDQIAYLASNVQINDILYVKVSAIIPESAEPFNLPINVGVNNSVETYKIQGYLVSQEGNIIFPLLGKVNVVGKTTEQVQELLAKLLVDNGYIKDPTVSVRIINSKVTVLGEVKSPGTYAFDEQNISLNQAIGYAGDLTINGARKDVLLIREVNGVRTYIRLDLTSSNWFNSPYYYVKQNDVIIVNPNGAKIMTSGYLTNIGTVMSILTLGLTVLILLKN